MKPSSMEIENQVNNILESKDFQASSKLSEFLRFIVRETIQGNAEQIKGYTIATKVLGRSDDFDQSKDPIVRILAGRLRRALEYYYHTNGKSDSVYINIPVGSYIPEFELIKNGSDNKGNGNHNPVVEDRIQEKKLVIAVLPFKDLSNGNNNNNIILNSLAENIIFELSRFRLFEISALKTNGRVSEDNLYELYRKNGARFLLEGSFRKEKNILKIFTELIDLKSNEVIWVEKFDIKIRGGDSLFNVEEDIANRIVPAIGSEYGIISRSIGSELKTKKYEYINDYEFIHSFYSVQLGLEKKEVKELLSSAERIIKTKADSGLLHMVAAGLSVFSFAFDLNAVRDPLDNASGHMIKAFTLEPGNQMVRAIRAALYFLLDNEKLFNEEAEAALLLNPSSPYYAGIYGFLLIHSGEYDKGIKYLNSGMELSCNYPCWWNIASAAYHYRNKEYENAYNESLKINIPDTFWSYLYSIASLGKMKRQGEAKNEVSKFKKIFPGFSKKGTGLLSRLIKDKKLLNDLTDGLNKAGMRIH
jgi:adenylate cyclase